MSASTIVDSTVTYAVPDVAGVIRLLGRCPSGECDPAQADITVRFPDLVDVRGGGVLVNTEEARHGIGDVYGRDGLRKRLQAAAGDFLSAAASAPPPVDVSFILNAVSLPWGGLSDIDGNWLPPHAAHRYGIDVDVRLKHLRTGSGELLRLLRQSLTAFDFTEVGAQPGNPSSDHWHARPRGFAPPSCVGCSASEVAAPAADVLRSATCPGQPNGVVLALTPSVSFDAGAGLYTYSYSAMNTSGSTQSLEAFEIDVGGEILALASPPGWAGLVARGHVRWFAASSTSGWTGPGSVPPSPDEIVPGASLAGFSFKSPLTPASARYRAWGFVPMSSVLTEAEAEDFLDQCPGTSKPSEGETTAPAKALSFFTVQPCRLVDTRTSSQPVESGTERTLTVIAPTCGIPSTALALSLNMTVTDATKAGHLRVYPTGSDVAISSLINFGAGQTRANNLVVGLGEYGELNVYPGLAAGGLVHVIIDVNGYFQ